MAGVQSLADERKNIREYEAYAELSREKRRLIKKLTSSPPSDPSSRLLLIKQLVNQFASKKRRLSRASADLEILLFANFN